MPASMPTISAPVNPPRAMSGTEAHAIYDLAVRIHAADQRLGRVSLPWPNLLPAERMRYEERAAVALRLGHEPDLRRAADAAVTVLASACPSLPMPARDLAELITTSFLQALYARAGR